VSRGGTTAGAVKNGDRRGTEVFLEVLCWARRGESVDRLRTYSSKADPISYEFD
jgi:hypothetical protein